MRLDEALPDPQTTVTLEPEELGWLLLPYLADLKPGSVMLHLGNLTTFTNREFREYAGELQEEMRQAIAEAWGWLLSEGMIAPRPGQEGRVDVTRRGRELAAVGDPGAYDKGRLLPRGVLDSELESRARAAFIRGQYQAAVLEAFKLVEIRVRHAAGLPEDEVGTHLMRTAFDQEKGILRDPTVSPAEREAAAHLFAGAIGLFRNPPAHRDISLSAEETVDLLHLANRLLRIVESRRAGAAVEP